MIFNQISPLAAAYMHTTRNGQSILNLFSAPISIDKAQCSSYVNLYIYLSEKLYCITALVVPPLVVVDLALLILHNNSLRLKYI